MRKFYKLVGAGELLRVSEAEYDLRMVGAIRPEFYEDLKKHLTGFNFMGAAYICIDESYQ